MQKVNPWSEILEDAKNVKPSIVVGESHKDEVSRKLIKVAHAAFKMEHRLLTLFDPFVDLIDDYVDNDTVQKTLKVILALTPPGIVMIVSGAISESAYGVWKEHNGINPKCMSVWSIDEEGNLRHVIHNP